ncbi:MAG: tetratricopeptide repeat protein [Flavobacteriales bacterium]|jgi:tetratricopeptide (TPR) repeat protein/polyferredoxin|nr:tetratricopeptide repeat protein [Flavobacteriales bacterium]MBK7286397.1 tetratricopeptide repeat protein [Flavobacteriales bacterium]
MATKRTRSFGKWRTATLVGVHLLFIAHFIHWKLRGRTLAPLEFNEVLYTIHQGIVTAGFIFMALVMVATLFFGRFFCSWGCHILALQDACGWMMDKLRIPRTSIRSRTLVWIPFVVMGYLFIWPQILALFHGLDPASLHVVEASAAGGWSSFSTDNLWRNLPPPGIAVLTFFICGFLIVYLLGSRGFCFQACPYGALFSIADQFAPGRIALNVAKDCTSCGLCTKACTSDILVHKELAQHGMVTNPRCMKDLDCIAACPEDAITYGFRKPPLFRKGHPLGTYAGRYSFSLGEDILLAVVFLIAMFIFRGLYDAVAFLMAVGLSVCTAYLVLMGFRLWKRKTMKVRGLVLRSDGRLHSAGVAYGVVVLALVAFTLHSGFVQFLTWQGKSAFKELAGAPAGKIDRTELDEAISHYEKALYYGLVAPIDRRKELANLYLLAGQAPKAITLLEGIVEQDPEHVEARYRLGELAMAAGDRKRALEHWRKTLELGTPRPHGKDEELLGDAALHVGIDLAGAGKMDEARAMFQRSLQGMPGDPRPQLALSALESAAGHDDAAIDLLEQALRNGAEEALVRNNLGALHLRQGHWQEALFQYDRLVQLRPGDSNAQYTLGVVQARTGDTSGARSTLQHALALDPGNARARTALSVLDHQGGGAGNALNEQ